MIILVDIVTQKARKGKQLLTLLPNGYKIVSNGPKKVIQEEKP